ncbi:TrkA family potassium uptake protein [Anaerolentibacter hominis]|uniref:potassium channel family protein n=1 Tax=Anaerolentibacter hominis TaxID=3079009 RepID=UPI0031B83363
MKSMLIIGMGQFGHHLCSKLVSLGNEVMIVDIREEMIEDLVPYVTSAKIGDCTNVDVLKSLGIGNFDEIFVCIGTNFQSSLEITSLVKELGGKRVISKANRDIHAKFLLRNGADEVVYPDRDVAEKIAVRYSANHVYDYIEVSDDFSIYEIRPMPGWIGKSIKELDIRAKYHVSVMATKKDGNVNALPPAEYILREDEHLMVIGKKVNIDRLLKSF